MRGEIFNALLYFKYILFKKTIKKIIQSTYMWPLISISGKSSENRRKLRVCVIGAGVSGIATTRQLAKDLDRFEITVFERSYEVGGTWLYTDETETDKYGYPVHSGMYKNLR